MTPTDRLTRLSNENGRRPLLEDRLWAVAEIKRLREALLRIANYDVDADLQSDANVLAGIAWAALTSRTDQP